jgi:hypothetical protein
MQVYSPLITNKNLQNAILRDFQMKAFFLATLLLLFKEMALLSSLLTFFSTAQQQSS